MQNGNYMLKEDVLNYFKRIRSMRFMDINMAEHNDEYYENNIEIEFDYWLCFGLWCIAWAAGQSE